MEQFGFAGMVIDLNSLYRMLFDVQRMCGSIPGRFLVLKFKNYH